MLKKNNKAVFKTDEVIVMLIITAVVSIALGSLIERERTSSSQTDSFMTELESNYKIIKSDYPDASDDDLLSGAISGMLKAVGDPYASLYTSDSNFNLYINGQYQGLGMQVASLSDNTVIVSAVFADSGASDADIRVGDQVIAVDDVVMSDSQNGETFANYVKASTNKTFTVIIKRDGEQLEKTVEKKNVIIPSVDSKIIESNGQQIGYIEVSIFSLTTYQQFKAALTNLEKEGFSALIIDLRGNSGGSLDTVSNMLSLLMSAKHPIYKTEEDGVTNTYYATGTKDVSYPIIILTDENSASASEIMASALSEQLGAVLVGKTTYGKGTVQEVKGLSNGDYYKVTTKKWLTSLGTWINEVGIKPDYEVDLSSEYANDPSDENDSQLQKALEVITNR